MRDHKVVVYVLFIVVAYLSGCTATSGLTKEESAYVRGLSDKKYSLVFSSSEIDVAWKRALGFLSNYYSIASESESEIHTNYNPDENVFRFTIKKEQVGENIEIKIMLYTQNAATLMFGGAMKNNVLLLKEYITTGKIEYARIFIP